MSDGESVHLVGRTGESGVIDFSSPKKRYIISAIIVALILVLIVLALGLGLGLGLDNDDDDSPGCIKDKEYSYRLPQSVRPVHYSLQLDFSEIDIFENKTTFYGEEVIDIEITQPTTCIFIHASTTHINITSFRYSYVNDDQKRVYSNYSSVEADLAKQWYRFKINDGFKKGSGEIYLTWEGTIPSYSEFSSSGIYWVPFEDAEVDTTDYLITTQLQPAWARFAFPCFDEPDFKAYYDFTYIVANPNITVLANTKEISQETIDNRTVHIFESTPAPMSTYLIALAIGNLSFVESITNGVRYRVYTHADLISKANFGLTETVNAVAFLENLFGQNYTFNKLDSIAVPKRGGAMENWGLINYAYNRILGDSSSTTLELRSAALTIYHELVHMWFGNMITCPWWNTTYQNEAWAMYYAFVTGDVLHPEWSVYEEFMTRYINTLSVDESGLNNPIMKPVDLPTAQELSSDLDSAFDSITYTKGGSILRMFREYIGQPWDDAMVYHLATYKFQNPTVADLLKSLQHANISDTVTQAFYNWTATSGFPYIEIAISNTSLSLYQSPNSPYEPLSTLWYIPIKINFFLSDGSRVVHQHYLDSPSVTINLPENTKFVIGNTNAAGFFSVGYDAELWSIIFDELQQSTTEFGEYDKVSLIASSFSNARSSKLEISETLKLTKVALANGNFSSRIYDLVLTELLELSTILQDQYYYGDFQTWVNKLITPTYESIGWENSVLADSLLRRKILFSSVYLEIDQAVEQANEIYVSWKNGSRNVSYEISSAVFYGVVNSKNSEVFNEILNLYVSQEHQGSYLQTDMLFGLVAGARELYDCEKVLKVIRESNQTVVQKIAAVSPMGRYNVNCKRKVFDFMKSSWEELLNMYGPVNEASGVWEGYVKSIPEFWVQVVAGENDLELLQVFMESHVNVFGERYVDKEFKVAAMNVEMLNKNAIALPQYLAGALGKRYVGGEDEDDNDNWW